MENVERKVKCTKQMCKQCRYVMNLTGAALVRSKDSLGLIACGYILKTGHSRVFENGKKKANYEPGYCNYYISGKRIKSFDDPLNKDGCNNTIKKGRRKYARTQ